MKVFVITMQGSADRRVKLEQQLSGINFEYFYADNLREESNHFVFSLYNPAKTKSYKGYELTIPELGCFASHLSLWHKCVELGESVLILEDNIIVSEELPQHIDMVREFSDKFGILKLCNLFESDYKVFESIDEKYSVISHLTKPGLGTQGYAISPRVAQAYLDKAPGFFEPVDNFMEHEWRTRQTVYSVIPNLVNRAPVASTIGRRKVKDGASLWTKVMPELYRVYVKFRRAIYNKRYK